MRVKHSTNITAGMPVTVPAIGVRLGLMDEMHGASIVSINLRRLAVRRDIIMRVTAK